MEASAEASMEVAEASMEAASTDASMEVVSQDDLVLRTGAGIGWQNNASLFLRIYIIPPVFGGLRVWIGIHRKWDSQKVRKASVGVVEASMEARGSFHGINFRGISESFHGSFHGNFHGSFQGLP